MDQVELRAICLSAATKTAGTPEQMVREAFAYELYLYGGAQVALDNLAGKLVATDSARTPEVAAPVAASGDDAPDIIH
ncbi:hypothetical protein [Ancylobacter sp.]|uniref:hypothetical protein n=1 Tax=Ancylobacter sp. TaxID=1872567 RepID=UPI003D1384CF